MDRLRVSVPTAKAGDSFVTYQVAINKGELVWKVKRRYQDFEKLHAAVKKALPADAVPELPPKTIRLGSSKFAPDFVESRRKGLESYLEKLVAAVEPERIEGLDDFLQYAEHCLAEAIGRLASVNELSNVVRMLRGATDRYRALTSAARGSGKDGGKGKAGSSSKRGGNDGADSGSDGSEDRDGPLPPPHPSSSSSSSTSAGDFLAVLREVVRMLTEYASILRGTTEDALEQGAATASSNVHLASRLRVRREETGDTLQLMASLRQRRADEAEKERSALCTGASQVRTVTAELRRVLLDQASLTALASLHGGELQALRALLAAWEKGSLPPRAQGAAGAAAVPLGPVRPELKGPSGALTAACGAAHAAATLIASQAGLPPPPAADDPAWYDDSDVPPGLHNGTLALPREPKTSGSSRGGRWYVPPAALADALAASDRVLVEAAGVTSAAGSSGGYGGNPASSSSSSAMPPGVVGTGPSLSAALLLSSIATDNAALLSLVLRVRAGAVGALDLPPLVPTQRDHHHHNTAASHLPAGGTSSGAASERVAIAAGGNNRHSATALQQQAQAAQQGLGGGFLLHQEGGNGLSAQPSTAGRAGANPAAATATASVSGGGIGASGYAGPSSTGAGAGAGRGVNPYALGVGGAPAAASSSNGPSSAFGGGGVPPVQPAASSGFDAAFGTGPTTSTGARSISTATTATSAFAPAPFTTTTTTPTGDPFASGRSVSTAPPGAGASGTSAAAALLRSKLAAGAASAPSEGNPFGGGNPYAAASPLDASFSSTVSAGNPFGGPPPLLQPASAKPRPQAPAPSRGAGNPF